MLWLSFVCEWGVGEVGHLVRDLEVLLCPFRLGNKSCPVKWTKTKTKLTPVKTRYLQTSMTDILEPEILSCDTSYTAC